MKIQNPYNCNNYTSNTNMNLTCKGCKRCVIYYEVECPEYDNNILGRFKTKEELTMAYKQLRGIL